MGGHGPQRLESRDGIVGAGARAVRKAHGTHDATALDPGKYTVVLEPTAAGNLLSLLAFSLNARAADEGRSLFSKRGGGNRIGEKIVDEGVTLVSDPQDPDLLTSPFTGEGLPVGRTVWSESCRQQLPVQ